MGSTSSSQSASTSSAQPKSCKGTINCVIPASSVTNILAATHGFTTIGDIQWGVRLKKEEADGVTMTTVFLKCFSVCQRPIEFAAVRTDMSLRIVCAHGGDITLVTAHDFTKDASAYGLIRFATWEQLVDPVNGFCVDGMIRIEAEINAQNVVTDAEVKTAPPVVEVDHSQPPIVDSISFDDALFTDMLIVVKGEEESPIACHRAVLCKNSKVIHAAMTNGSTVESQKGVFEIGEACATALNVTLFVRAMYREWHRETMDGHVAELLMLAHFYDSERVNDMALHAISRLLSPSTFWHYLNAAVFIAHSKLIDLCVSYAMREDGKHMWSLVNGDDGREMTSGEEAQKSKTVAVLVREMGKKQAKQ